MKRLEGQVAIVTGGARGIGKGICEVFCREGATVALWDVLDGTETVNEITQNGGNIFFQKVDVTDQNSVDSAIEEIIKQHGKIEILINNAGIIRDRSFLKMWGKNHKKLLNNLEALRKSAGLTQQELSVAAEVSRKSINAIENGIYIPSTVLALKIAKTIKCNVEDLFKLP